MDWDAPLKNPADDKLGRDIFAKNIFKIIKSLPVGNHRFAITGEWGTGKSTVLNFIKHYAEQAGYPVVKFNPWEFDNKKDMWQGFVAEIDNGLNGLQGTSYGLFAGKSFLRFLLPVIKKIMGRVSYGDLFNDLFLSRMEGSLDETKENIAVRLKQKLKHRKLLIFIDDLDRAQPELVYQVLVLIKEIIDVKGCVFVCAIDEKQTINILRRNFKFTDPKSFLDKIFHTCFPLTKPNPDNKLDLIETELEKLSGKVKKDIILKFIGDLPEDNSRVIKKYLRYLSYLDDFLKQRFDDDEIDWELVYYAEILKHKFPNKLEPLLRCDLSKYFYSVNNDDGVKILDKILNELYNDDSIKNDIKKDFIELKSLFLIRKGVFLGIESYFNILSTPIIMTNKEYLKWRERSKENIVSQKFNNRNIKNNVKRNYLYKLIEKRKSILSNYRNRAKIHENLLQEALALTDELKYYIVTINIENILDLKTLKDLFERLSEECNFDSDDYYEIRKKEQETAIKLAEATLSFAEEMIPYIESSIRLPGEQFVKTLDTIEGIYKEGLKTKIINGFNEPNGFWKLNSNLTSREILFTKNDYLYSEDSVLLKLAKSADNNKSIFENLVDFLILLFSGSDEESQKILTYEFFRETFWEAVTKNPITKRYVGSLLKGRQNVLKTLNRDDILPIPSWVEKKYPDLYKKYK